MNHHNVEMTSQEKDAVIAKLRKENKELRSTRVTRVTKEVEVPPPDYKELKRTCRRQEERIRNLQHIIETGNISTLGTQIDEYTNYSRSRLKSISHEAAMTSFSEAEVHKVIGFVEYLNYVSSEIYGLVSVYENGKTMTNPAIRVCASKLNKLIEFISRKSFLSTLDESRIPQFMKAVSQFQAEAQACLKERDDP